MPPKAAQLPYKARKMLNRCFLYKNNSIDKIYEFYRIEAIY